MSATRKAMEGRTSLPLMALLAASAAGGCSRSSAPAVALSKPNFLAAEPTGDVAPLVHDSLARATVDQRRLVVYVGAKWCEPCQRFHRAVEGGELDSAFLGVTFFEFDLDRDGDRLKLAGYVSKFIPLFALPAPDGKASGKQVEGGIKGDGAVAYMTPRLEQLLAP